VRTICLLLGVDIHHVLLQITSLSTEAAPVGFTQPLELSRIFFAIFIFSGIAFQVSTIRTEKKFARTSNFAHGFVRFSSPVAILILLLLSAAILNH
jgi:hypothetical protein